MRQCHNHGPFNRSFNSLFDVANAFERDMADFAPQGRHFLNVDVDVNEQDDYVISAEAPGAKLENVEIKVENGIVAITIEYKEEDKNPFRNGKYARSFRLNGIDTEKTSAILRDGILTIILPKAESAKPRKVDIKAE